MQKVVVFDESGSANPVREVDYGYTHEGAVNSITGSIQPTSYVYDERYRVLSMTDGNSHTTTYDYDTIGNLADIYYPLASGQFDKTAYTYDPDQNLLTEVDGRGVITTYTRADPESLVTKVAYTNLPGNVTSIQPVNYTYDDFGRRSGMNDGDGVSTGSYKYTYGYDDLDELLSSTVSFPGGPQNQTLSYLHNNDGSRLSLATPSNLSNPLTAINGGKFGYTYDGVGRLTQLNVPFTVNGINGTAGDYLKHYYLPNGWLNQTSGLRMNSSGTLSTLTYYTYNPRGFLTKLQNYQQDGSTGGLTNSSTFTGLGATDIAYDAVGNRLGLTANIPGISSAPNASRTVAFSYDTGHSLASQNRDVLTAEASSPTGSGSSLYNDTYTNSFTYDAAYNPTAFSIDNSPLAFPVNLDNQFSTSSLFAWDGAGNPTTYNSQTFSFDPENRLTHSTSPVFSAAYDGDGLRITKTATPIGGSSAVTTYFLYDGSTPVLEEQMSGSAATLTAVNVEAADGMRARYFPTLSSQFYAFTYDPQGSQVGSQYSGNTTNAGYATSSYEAYGHRGASYDNGGHTPPANQSPFGFGGQFGYYTDVETGLLCLTHRYYDPGTGKFINRDPIGYEGGANLYGFCEGNPVNESDPSGLWNIYKAIYTGDGNASDDVYNAAVAQGAATLTFEGKTMLQVNKQLAGLVIASAGIGTVQYAGVPKSALKLIPKVIKAKLGIRVIVQSSAKTRGATSFIRMAAIAASKIAPGSRAAQVVGTRADLVKALVKSGQWRGVAARTGIVGLAYTEAGIVVYPVLCTICKVSILVIQVAHLPPEFGSVSVAKPA